MIRALHLKHALFVGMAIAIVISTPVHAGTRAAASIGVRIIEPISIEKIHELDIGWFRRPQSGATIAVAADGASTYAGVQPGRCWPPQPAQFVVTGEPGFSYSILLPTSITLCRESEHGDEGDEGDRTITADDFQTSLPGVIGLIGADGTQHLNVGATFHLSTKQSPGHYDCTLTVSVYYN